MFIIIIIIIIIIIHFGETVVVILSLTMWFVVVGRLTSVQEVRAGVYKALFPESAGAVVPLRAHSCWAS